MARNLQTGIRESIRASINTGLTGGNLFSAATLDLNFAVTKALDPLVTFTRASTATYIGSNGLIKVAPANLKSNSEGILSANGYSQLNATITADTTTFPVGINATSLLKLNVGANTGNNNDGFHFGNTTLANSTQHTQSLFVKPAGTTVLRIRSNVSGLTADFTLTGSGTAPSTSTELQGASIVALTNGWYRASWTYTTTTTAPGNRFDYWTIKTNVADGVNGIYVTGAQIEQSSTVSEYIFTASTVNSIPRFDHDPVTGESLGLLIEEARTNLLLNSATLSTQTRTVTAVAHTLSFYGTGTVTLTGVSTAGPLVGTGANNRVSLTFTPTAGSLIVTVSGSVTNAQLEVGSFPTSYIPTVASTVTRAADVASITGTNFSSWYNQTEGTVLAEYKRITNASGRIVTFNDTTANEQISIIASPSTNIRPDWQVIDGGVVQANVLGAAEVAVGATRKTAGTYKLNDFQQATNSTLGTADTTGTLPTLTVLNIGANETGSGSMINGTIKRITFWPSRLANPTLQALTAP